MTREEAIQVLNMVEAHGSLVIQAKEMAIKALEQEPSEDAISRQAVHEAITRWAGSMSVLIALPTREVRPLLDSIHKLPSVNPQESKQGHWKRISMDKYSEHAKYWYRCDKCGEKHLGNTNYCPNCGCRME